MSAATHVHERGEREIATLWEEFKATGDERAREGLILHYSPLVKFVAGRLGSGLPRNVESSDLVSGAAVEPWAVAEVGRYRTEGWID